MIIKSELEFKDEVIPYFYITGDVVVNYFLEILKKDSPERLSIDLETYPRDKCKGMQGAGLIPILSKIRTLQVYDGKKVVILDFLNPEDESYLLSHKPFAEKFYDFLLHANELIAHNALFETAHIQRVAHVHNFWNCRLHIYCTMNLWRLLACSQVPESRSLGSSLKAVSKFVLKTNVLKDEQKSDWSKPKLSAEQLHYCALDAVLPYKIFEKLEPQVRDELWDVYELNTKAQEPVAAMHLHGMAVDRKKHAALMKKWKEKQDEYEKKCFELLNLHNVLNADNLEKVLLEKVAKKWHEKITTAIRIFFGTRSASWQELSVFRNVFEEKALQLKTTTDKEAKSRRTAYKRVIKNIDNFLVSPSSSKQISTWLEKHMDRSILSSWPITETGQFKTDAETLKDKAKDAGLEYLLHYKHFSKLYSTYGVGLEKFFIDTGKNTIICPNFSLCLTETGRMSSFRPNFQNQPRDSELRSIFISSAKDRKLLVADFSQIEIRLAAYFSKDKVLLKGYRDGIDVHTLTASRVMHKSIKAITKEERQLAKNLNFCLLFGGGVSTLQAYAKRNYGISISEQEAKRLVNGFREAYPEFRAWQLRQAACAERTLVTCTKTGKVRALDQEYTYTVSMNMPIQGTAAEIMLQSLINVHTFIWKKGFDAKIVNCVHDEIMVDCQKGYVDEMKEAVEVEMTRAMKKILDIDDGHPLLNNLVDCGVGSDWSSAK